jgi:hypothetical protein
LFILLAAAINGMPDRLFAGAAKPAGPAVSHLLSMFTHFRWKLRLAQQ